MKRARKGLPLILSAVLVLAGCANGGLAASSAPPASSAAEAPLPSPENTELKDYLSWCQKLGVAPGADFESNVTRLSWTTDEQVVVDGLYYPSAWPRRQLEGFLPEYTGEGWIYEVFIHHPTMSYAREYLRGVTVTIYDYDPGQVDAYRTVLTDSGFTELPTDGLSPDFTAKADDIASFESDRCELFLIYSHDDMGEFLQFMATYRGVPEYRLPEEPGGDTELLDFFAWAKANGYDTGDAELDDRTDVAVQGSAQSSLIQWPSRWPIGCFGGLVPQYTGAGVLHSLMLAKADAQKGDDTAVMAGLALVEIDRAAVRAYGDALVAYGYYELGPEEYSDYERELADRCDEGFFFVTAGTRFSLCLHDTEDGLSAEFILNCDNRILQLQGA